MDGIGTSALRRGRIGGTATAVVGPHRRTSSVRRGRRPGPGGRLVAIRVGLVGLGLLVPLLALEVALRVAGPILPGAYQTASFATRSTVIGRQNRPNSVGWVRTSEYSTRIRINSQGLRGPEISYAKEPGAFRVLVLGDSFMFGRAVGEHETFAARLAHRSAVGAGARRVEAINAGTPGWTTANEYVWMVREGYRYDPDLALLMFFNGNDPDGNDDQVGAPEQARELQWAEDPDGPLAAVWQGLRDRSTAFNFVEQGVLVKLAARAPAARQDERPLSDGQRAEAIGRLWGTPPAHPIFGLDTTRELRGWLIAEALLEQLRDFCAARKIPLVVVEVPAERQVEAPAATTTPLPAMSARLGLPYIELLGAFRAVPPRDRAKLYLREDKHWSDDAHDKAARVVAAELIGRGLLPGVAAER
jgi:hypothetical protein